MIGVVLWSDAALNRAVIWCEDQGDLALFRQEPEFRQARLGAGDWVEFDLVLRGNLRLAENPVVLADPASPEIAVHLAAAVSGAGPQSGSGEPPAGSGAVIPFPSPRSSSPAAAASHRLSQGRL